MNMMNMDEPQLSSNFAQEWLNSSHISHMAKLKKTRATALVLSSTFWTAPSEYDLEILEMLKYGGENEAMERCTDPLLDLGKPDAVIVSHVEYLLSDYFARLLSFVGTMHPKWRKNEDIPKQYCKDNVEIKLPNLHLSSAVTQIYTFHFNGVDVDNSFMDVSVSMIITIMTYHLHMLFRFYAFMLFKLSLTEGNRLEKDQNECLQEWTQILSLFGMSTNALSIFDFYSSAPSNLLRYGWEDQTELSASSFYASKRRNHVFLEGFVLDGKSTFLKAYRKTNPCVAVNEYSIIFRLRNNHMLSQHPELLPIAFFSSLCVSSFSRECAHNLDAPFVYDRGIFANETFKAFRYGDPTNCIDTRDISKDLSMCNLFLCFALPNRAKVYLFEPKQLKIEFPLTEHKGNALWKDRSFENTKIKTYDELINYGNMFRQGILFVLKRFATQYS